MSVSRSGIVLSPDDPLPIRLARRLRSQFGDPLFLLLRQVIREDVVRVRRVLDAGRCERCADSPQRVTNVVWERRLRAPRERLDGEQLQVERREVEPAEEAPYLDGSD